MKFCVNCGKEIDDNANACGFCGALQGAPSQGAPQMQQGQPFGAGQYAPYGARPKAKGGLNIGGIVAIVGFVLILIGMFIPIRGIAGGFVTEVLSELGGSAARNVSTSASLFTANLAIGIITLILVIAGLAVACIHTFVKPLGIIAPIAEGVSALWTFIAMFIARSAAVGKVIRAVTEAQYAGSSYMTPMDIEEEIAEALSNPMISLVFSTKFGFWLILIGVLAVIAGIVMGFVMKGGSAKPAGYPQY